MILTIEVSCKNAQEMEDHLNKAIDDLSKAFLRKGFIEIVLLGFKDSIDESPIYKVVLTEETETNSINSKI